MTNHLKCSSALKHVVTETGLIESEMRPRLITITLIETFGGEGDVYHYLSTGSTSFISCSVDHTETC